MKMDYWKLFEETGSINDYLNYACTSEESQLYNREEGDSRNEPGNLDGDGFVGNAHWGV